MDRVIVIFGASDGIGLEASKLFLDNEDIVYNCSRHLSEVKEVRNKVVDIVNTEEVNKALTDIFKTEGKLNVIINCAGFSMAAPLEYSDSADYRYLFDVNFFGVVEVCKAAVPFMKERNGRIINISSFASLYALPFDPYYSAAKAALNVFTEGMQYEFRKRGIFMTSLLLGGTKTEFTFKRKIYGGDNEYRQDLDNAVSALRKIEQTGLCPKKAAEAVYKLSLTPDPPILATCGCKGKLLYCANKFLPKSCVYNLTRCKFNV